MALAIPFDIAAAVLPMLGGGSVLASAVCAGLGSLALSAAFVARFIAQKEFDDGQTPD